MMDKTFRISKHKSLEVSFSRDFDYWFRFVFCCDKKGDHKGVLFTCTLFGFNLGIELFDVRHWNYKAHRFYLIGEEEEADHAFLKK